MDGNNGDELQDLASRLQDAFMSMEAVIPEIEINGQQIQMSLNQVRTLHFVSMEPGIHQKEIANRLAITQASVSLMIRKMTQLGLMERRPDELDGRAQGLYLTPLGSTIYGELRNEQITVMREFLSAVSLEEQRVLVEAMEKALDNLQKLNETAGY